MCRYWRPAAERRFSADGISGRDANSGPLALREYKPVSVVTVIALKICVLTPEKAAPGRTVQAEIYCSGDQVAHHSPSILSTKHQRSILIFANQSSGEGRPTSAFSDAP